MSRVGLNASTGRLIYGWEHCVQCIKELLLTEIGERLQRRLLGSKIPRAIDRPQNEETVIDIYMGTAQALEPRIVEGRQYGEPGFVLLRTSLDASEPGRLILLLGGVFFERGHLGDYSNPSERQIAFTVTEGDDGLLLEAA